MMKQVLRLVVCVLGVLALAAPASAQALPWEGRAYANVNFGMQLKSTATVAATQTFSIYDETGSVKNSQNIDAQAPFIEFGAGVRVFGNFGVGVEYTRLSTTGASNVTASVPSPLVYDSFRSATASVTDLEHVEQAFHFQLIWMLPITDKLDATFSAGPTAFRLKQGTVLTPTVSEVGSPYTSVNLTTTMAETTGSRMGFNVGGDLSYRFANHLGVGAMIRYSGATFDLKPTGGSPLNVKVGGLQFGAGLRIRF
jgi:opacity protein-like surface antigen